MVNIPSRVRHGRRHLGTRRGGFHLQLADVIAALRRHWRLAAAGVILGIAAAAVYYVTRSDETPPKRFTASATVSIPSSDKDALNRDTSTPSVLMRGQEALAASGDTLKAARAAANIADDVALGVSADKNETGDVLTLKVVGSDDKAVAAFISKWPDAFVSARSKLVKDSLDAKQEDLVNRISNMTKRKNEVESQLKLQLGPNLPPIVYTASLEGSGDSNNSTSTPPLNIQIPATATDDAVLLIYERNALYNHIAEARADYAESKVNTQGANPYATVLGYTGAVGGGGKKKSPLVPMGGLFLAGVLAGLAAAVLRDRLDKTIRSPRAAARSLSAPVLTTIPPRRRARGEYTVLEAPTAERSLAFRSLAATSIATDRLPRAILVSTPRGEAQDDVAANFAAALATLGLRVALIGTTPRQGWFAWPFRTPDAGLATFPDFLALARSGRLNGQVERNVAFDDLNPNLVVIPPGDTDQLFMPLDGLPTLLESLRRSDVDITVIAGPALLEDANATIIAWATRSVLWAVEMGAATEQDLSEASNRLQLAGVTPFGVAVIGAEE
jgi:Mrp family chromosome partitioning ATPase